MIAIPIALFVILVAFACFMLFLIVSAIVGYVAYCHKVDNKKKEIIENTYGEREQD